MGHCLGLSSAGLIHIIADVVVTTVCRPTLGCVGRGEESGREEVQGDWRGVQRAVGR